MDTTARERTDTRSDPRTLAAAATGRDGLSFLRAMADGTLPPPPIMTLVGAGVESVEHGRVVSAVEPAEYHDNPIGSVHGGIYATLLDAAAGCAVHSTVKFLRRLTADSGTSRATGDVVHSGRSTAPVRCTGSRLPVGRTQSFRRWARRAGARRTDFLGGDP